MNSVMLRLRTWCMHCGHVLSLARFGNSKGSGRFGGRIVWYFQGAGGIRS